MHPATILIVDDEPSVLALVRTILWRAGYTVLEADGGEAALNAAAGHAGSIELLLSDVLMPDMSGYELADRFRQVRPEAKLLFMTGYRDKVLAESTGRVVADAPVVRKPFTAYTLVGKIEELLGGGVAPSVSPSEIDRHA